MSGNTITGEVENGLPAFPYTVVKIEGESNQTPGMVSSGTGFFYRVDTKSGPIMMIATNKHVIDGLDVLRFHMPLTNSAGRRSFEPAEIVSVNAAFYPIFRHPDPSVDIAMVAAMPILESIAAKTKSHSFYPCRRITSLPNGLLQNFLHSQM